MQGLIAICHSSAEPAEAFTLRSSKETDDVSRNLKRSHLKIEQSGGKNETEIDMNQSAILHTDQNVAIVAILDLKDVTDKRVGSQAVGKIFDR